MKHMIVRIAWYQGRIWFLCRCGEPCVNVYTIAPLDEWS